MLEVSPAAIKKWIQQGKLAAFRTPGGHFRILAEEFERFQKSHGFVTASGEPLRVLITDGEREVADVIKSSLRSFYPKARIETAGNGVEGLVKVGRFRPDVLLLDQAMPGMDGFEVCRQMKQDPANRDIKIVIIAAPHDDAEPRAKEAGADGFLRKPFEPADLHSLVSQVFGRRH
jgi:excisionase family DNA binding protein